MRRLVFVLLAMVSTSVLANVAQQLPNKQWAYYGSDFYQKLASRTVTKELLNSILNAKHSSFAGKPDTIGSCSGSCYSHVSVGYDGARKILFGEIYTLKDSQGTYILDVYCGKKFHFRSVEEASNMHTDINIEHTWPQSKFSSRYEKGMQKSDMHHLFLTDSDANNRRGNHEFGNAMGRTDELNVADCSISQLVDAGKDWIFQPPKTHRGNVARALFYFSSHYNLPISKDQEDALREWHKADPADESELARHEMVAQHQKVRNPFVDHPELVDIIKDF